MYFLLSDMGAIDPIILTLSLIIYTKAGPVGSNTLSHQTQVCTL